jgi:3-oxoacyl-(acyl-carrier-protein) synthase
MFVAGAGSRKPYGWLAGFGIARDTTAPVSDWGDDPGSVVTAMSQAMRDAEVETVDAALIGGVEEANEMLFSVLDRLGALDDQRQNGIVIGEGAAVLVAGAGTRKPYAYLSGFGIARDTSATISDWGTGYESVVAAMKAAIDDAELTLADIDAIYVSANGSRRADALESRAIDALFGARVPKLITTKNVFGEYAAGGALQLVEAIRGVENHRNVLVNSLSAGGGIVCAVVSA